MHALHERPPKLVPVLWERLPAAMFIFLRLLNTTNRVALIRVEDLLGLSKIAYAKMAHTTMYYHNTIIDPIFSHQLITY